MKQPTLYLLVGYPGSGKTTTSRIIHDLTGAAHIWADSERQKMFGQPTHSHAESDALYTKLNQQTADLLQQGSDVVFDTNFSFRADREHLRTIAGNCGARTVLIWLQVDPSVARERATADEHADHNGYDNTMEIAVFERIVSHLEPPTTDEKPLLLDGTRITPEYVSQKLGITQNDTGSTTAGQATTA